MRKLIEKLVLICILSCFHLYGFSQEILEKNNIIEIEVLDSYDRPLMGVIIAIYNTTNVCLTDSMGLCSLKVNNQKDFRLKVNSLGYSSFDVFISEVALNFKMKIILRKNCEKVIK